MAPSIPADEAAIREQAYYFWEAEGRPEGREQEFWQRAAVAVAEKGQLDTLTKGAPKRGKAEAKLKAAKAAPKVKAASKVKAAASTAKAAPAKAAKAGKPKPKKS